MSKLGVTVCAGDLPQPGTPMTDTAGGLDSESRVASASASADKGAAALDLKLDLPDLSGNLTFQGVKRGRQRTETGMSAADSDIQMGGMGMGMGMGGGNALFTPGGDNNMGGTTTFGNMNAQFTPGMASMGTPSPTTFGNMQPLSAQPMNMMPMVGNMNHMIPNPLHGLGFAGLGLGGLAAGHARLGTGTGATPSEIESVVSGKPHRKKVRRKPGFVAEDKVIELSERDPQLAALLAQMQAKESHKKELQKGKAGSSASASASASASSSSSSSASSSKAAAPEKPANVKAAAAPAPAAAAAAAAPVKKGSRITPEEAIGKAKNAETYSSYLEAVSRQCLASAFYNASFCLCFSTIVLYC